MRVSRKKLTTWSNRASIVVIGSLLGWVPGLVHAQTRIEMRAIETVTLSTQQLLAGDNSGKPTTLAGELRIPKPGADKLPAVILMHAAGGLGPSHDRWAQELDSIGVATFILDSFSDRGITTIAESSKLDDLAMMPDAYRALAVLAQHPRIDPSRIAIMGFSKGAIAAVYSSSRRFRKAYGPPNVEFAAHIGVYTPCQVTYRGDGEVTGKPIRLFHGIADETVPIEQCRRYVERLKKSGVDIALSEYPGAYHVYDLFFLKEPVKLQQARTSRNCLLAEGDAGQILNNDTGKPLDSNDACVEKAVTITVGYNEAATTSTIKAVKEFLVATFHLGQ